MTVIIPTFNWSSVLPYSIGSVRRQTFTDWELLVIGDGCTDDSGAVVARVADDRVRWINLPANTGHQSGPNNEGVRQARGEVIAYLGHDDLWLPDHLALLVGALDAGAGLAYGITELVGVDRGDVERAPARPGPYRPGLWLPPSGVVHRRNALIAAGGWPAGRRAGLDAEARLWMRMRELAVAFTAVERLTAVKLPAAWRREVYRLRPSHEQAEWFARIGAEPDFETTELTRIRESARSLRWRRHRAWLGRVARRALGRDPASDEIRRRVKGLDPRP